MQRRQGDTILIGDDIEIQILETSRAKVKIGLTVPRQLRILRGEFRQVGEENRLAAGVSTTRSLQALARRMRQAGGDKSLSPGENFAGLTEEDPRRA